MKILFRRAGFFFFFFWPISFCYFIKSYKRKIKLYSYKVAFNPPCIIASQEKSLLFCRRAIAARDTDGSTYPSYIRLIIEFCSSINIVLKHPRGNCSPRAGRNSVSRLYKAAGRCKSVVRLLNFVYRPYLFLKTRLRRTVTRFSLARNAIRWVCRARGCNKSTG